MIIKYFQKVQRCIKMQGKTDELPKALNEENFTATDIEKKTYN